MRRSWINWLNPSSDNSSLSCYAAPAPLPLGSLHNGNGPYRISINIDRTFLGTAAASVGTTPGTASQHHSSRCVVEKPVIRPPGERNATPPAEALAAERNTPVPAVSSASPPEQNRGLASSEHGRPSPSFDRSFPAKAPHSFAATDVHDIYTSAEIRADLEPYKQENIRLAHCSDTVTSIQPGIRAWNRQNILLAGPDGKVRRFPPDNGTQSRTSGGIPGLGRTLARQTHFIYDARVEHIRHTVAEYVVNPANATMTFMVEGRPSRSVLPDRAMYALPGKKWMVPQSEFRDCTFACEAMLLAEGQPADKARKIVSDTPSPDQPRDTEELCASLRERSGAQTKVIEQGRMSDKAFIKQLETSIKRYGPCIFSPQRDHAYVCDEVEGDPDAPVFTVRDPFSANCLKIDAHAFLRTTPFGGMAEKGNGEAIFLLKESSCLTTYEFSRAEERGHRGGASGTADQQSQAALEP
jgi:hypothetical protein